MSRIVGIIVLFMAAATVAFAGVPAPEIDASSGAAAIGLLGGAALILRSRKKK